MVETADLNGDGRSDILAGYDGHVSVYLTEPGGTRGQGSHYVSASSAAHLAAADFDGDGFVDVVTAGAGDSASSPVVCIMRGDAAGTLQAAGSQFVTRISSGSSSSALIGAGLFDVTGDGKLDAITVSGERDQIIVLPGNGDGTAGDAIRTSLSGSGTPKFGDFNGDGLQDILLSSSWAVECRLAEGDGTFRSTMTLGIGGEPFTGDFDGDGKVDFVQWSNGFLSLYPGNGDGSFAAAVSVPFFVRDALAVADMNNDGIDDVVTWTDILFGSATRTFTSLRYEQFYEHGPAAIVDLNGDGNLDIVKYEILGTAASVMVRLGAGDGTFGPPRTLRTDQRGGTNPLKTAVVGDFDADGDADLAFHSTVLLGDGAGWFDGYARFRDYEGPYAAAAGDLDGNGSSDLLFINQRSDSIALVRTWNTDSRENPITVTMGPTPPSVPGGLPVDLTAIASGSGTFVPAGAVVFRIGDEIGTISEIHNGVASGRVHASGAAGSTTSLHAQFGGDDHYAASAVSSVPVTVTRAQVSMFISLTPEPPLTTDDVEVGCGLLSPLSGTPPSGTVTVLVDGVSLGTGSAPIAYIDVGRLAAGTRTLKVQYSGDAAHAPSETAMTVTVEKAVPAMTLTIAPEGSSNVGQDVVLYAALQDTTTTGQVQFYRGSTHLASATILPGGKAAVSTDRLPVGLAELKARFTGNSIYKEATVSSWYTIVDVPLAPSASSLWVLTPCRVIDTRGAVGPSGGPALASAGTRGVQMTGVCGIPHGAKAVALNVTVVSPGTTGYLTLYPGASARPGTSTMSYRTQVTRANNSVMSLSTGGILNVFNGGSLPAHFIIDVMGYFQ